jgi:hypothetical protein
MRIARLSKKVYKKIFSKPFIKDFLDSLLIHATRLVSAGFEPASQDCNKQKNGKMQKLAQYVFIE